MLERRQETENNILEMQIGHLRTDFAEVKASVNILADAIGKLAIIEERQAYNQSAINGLGEKVDRIDERLHSIESQLPAITAQSNNSSRWIAHALTGMAAASVMYVAQTTGLLS